MKPRFLKKSSNGIVFPWTEILAKREDMHECDKEGNLFDVSPIDDSDLISRIEALEAENAALRERLKAMEAQAVKEAEEVAEVTEEEIEEGITLESCGDDKAKLMEYAESKGISIDGRASAAKMKELLA